MKGENPGQGREGAISLPQQIVLPTGGALLSAEPRRDAAPSRPGRPATSGAERSSATMQPAVGQPGTAPAASTGLSAGGEAGSAGSADTGQQPQRRAQQSVHSVDRRSLTADPGAGEGATKGTFGGGTRSGSGEEPAGTFSGPLIKDLAALLNRPKAGGGIVDADATRIVPVAENYRLVHTPGEEGQREELLGKVTVDERGIASSKDEVTGITTSLVAVRIQDHEATVVPFELTEDGLVLPLPGNTGSQIGFFIGHDGGEDHKPSAVIRQGDYPGIPLTTDIIQDNLSGEDRTREIMINMGGIKEQEKDETTWAEQVGLFDALGFDPFKTRGIFSKSHRENAHTTTWKNQRLIIVPDDMRDLVDHHDAFDVTQDLLQINTYGTQAVKRRLVRDTGIWPDMFGGGSGPTTMGIDLRGGTERSKGLGVGFGSTTTSEATTTSTEISGLTSAFQIRVAPREN